jgi:hypothetical protein
VFRHEGGSGDVHARQLALNGGISHARPGPRWTHARRHHNAERRWAKSQRPTCHEAWLTRFGAPRYRETVIETVLCDESGMALLSHFPTGYR